MTETQLAALARQAAEGNETAGWFLFCRLARLVELLDRETLERVAEFVAERRKSYPAPEVNGKADHHPIFPEAQDWPPNVPGRVPPELIEKDRREFTAEVAEAMSLEAKHLLEHGGYSIDDILRDFEKTGEPS